jgi:basic amino acid/polyamine antiporter, APA family
MQSGTPERRLAFASAVTIIIGIVVGAGIFRTPSLVAGVTGDVGWALLIWVLGGVISLIGALCYAELASTYPHAGGDYHFLSRAYGRQVSFLYAWAKAMVINTGSIALLAFVFGDYLSAIVNLGSNSSAIWAVLIVLVLTVVNVTGLRIASSLQAFFTVIVFIGLLMVAASAFWVQAPAVPSPPLFATTPPLGMMGLAMVFVLLTFGGWNESAYISAEVKGGAKTIVSVIVVSLFLTTVLYVLVNLALIHGLGLSALASSQAPASDLVLKGMGLWAEWLVSALVALAALTSINATMIVGARANYALGNDWMHLRFIGQWRADRGVPVVAHIVQAMICVALIGLGSLYADGFEAMVEFTAPVFWGFLFLVGLGLMRLRRVDPDMPRPYKVPFYPVLPIIFCLTCGYLTYSSIVYAHSQGAVHISLLVMVVGAVALMMLNFFKKPRIEELP